MQHSLLTEGGIIEALKIEAVLEDRIGEAIGLSKDPVVEREGVQEQADNRALLFSEQQTD